MRSRMIERSLKLFLAREPAQAIVQNVPAELVQLLERDDSKLRSDSHHIESNKAPLRRD